MSTIILQPDHLSIPILSDEHGIFSFSDPFEQNETTQGQQFPMDIPQSIDETPLSADFYLEVNAELPPLYASQTQAIKTPLIGEDVETLSTELYQPLYTLMGSAEANQNVANAEVHLQEVLFTLPQEIAVDMEPTDMDPGTLIAYRDLGALPIDYTNMEALCSATDMELLLNVPHQFGNVLMRDAKHQPNTADLLAHLQTPTTSSDSTNDKVRNATENGDRNMACPTLSSSASGQSFGSVLSDSGQSVVQSDKFKPSFVNHENQKLFQCDVCQKQFRTSSSCQRHRRIHTGEKLFKCDFCQKEFNDRSNCQTHRRIHTGEKPFKCDMCPKQFRASNDYRAHRRTHTGEKPYQCDICSKQLRTSSNYQAHRRIHSGEKPFECDICAKQFSTSSNYRTHLQTHSVKKRFICYWCNQSYSSKRSLIEHIRKCPSRNTSCTTDD